MAEDGEEESRKKHFNLKAIQEREAYSNKKMKKKTKGSVDNQEDDFKVIYFLFFFLLFKKLETPFACLKAFLCY